MLQTTIQGRYQFRFHEPSKAPKARSILAQGEALGSLRHHLRELKARSKLFTLPFQPWLSRLPSPSKKCILIHQCHAGRR